MERSWGSCPRTAPAELSQGMITHSPGGSWLLLFLQQGGSGGTLSGAGAAMGCASLTRGGGFPTSGTVGGD